MTIPDLPLELWERILEYASHETQLTLRNTCKSWRRHIDRRIIPETLLRDRYRVPDISILLFNGFHQYRNNQALQCTGTQRDLFNPYRDTISDYAVFSIVDPLRYFKLNRLDDIEDLYLVRDCPDLVMEECRLFETLVVRRCDVKRHGMIGADEQSILVPYHLLWRDDWEVQVPVTTTEPFVDGVAVSLYGMGTPDQTWSTTFSTGANMPY